MQLANIQRNVLNFILSFAVPPKIDLSIQMKSLITVKAGSNVCLDAQVFGKPMPTVSWKKDGVDVKPAEGIKITSKRNLFLLELFSVNRKETGEYTIVAENASGSKTATIKLKVLGKFKFSVLFYCIF